MGSRFEVWCWEPRGYGRDGYEWVQKYASERLLPALWFAWRAKRRGVGCVRLEWR